MIIFFQCPIIILEKLTFVFFCKTELYGYSVQDFFFKNIHWFKTSFLNIWLALKRAVKIRWLDSRRNPTIVLVVFQTLRFEKVRRKWNVHCAWPTWLPEVTEGNVTPKGIPWMGERMHNRKLRNIRLSGAFWPEMTLSNVTRRAFPGTGSRVTGSTLGGLSRTSASYNLIIF